MAEFLLRVVDKVNPDSLYRDVKCTKRGDIIVVKEDGETWGKDQKILPQYRIIKVPGMDVSEARAWVAPELDTDPQQPSRTLQARKFTLDLDTLLGFAPAPVVAYIADDSRVADSFTLTGFVTLNQMRALKKTKPVIVDPNL